MADSKKNSPAAPFLPHCNTCGGRPDIIEVNEDLQNHLSECQLKQKYWLVRFTDLVIDRSWATIEQATQGEPKNE